MDEVTVERALRHVGQLRHFSEAQVREIALIVIAVIRAEDPADGRLGVGRGTRTGGDLCLRLPAPAAGKPTPSAGNQAHAVSEDLSEAAAKINGSKVIDVAYLVLVGTGGWNQRWEIASGQEEKVSAELLHIGTRRTGHLPLLDPETDKEITFIVAWKSVAVAMIVPSPAAHAQPHGQYA